MNLELQLVKSVINHPHNINEITENLKEEDFLSDRMRSLYVATKNALAENKNASGKELIPLLIKYAREEGIEPKEEEIIEIFSDSLVASPNELIPLVRENTARRRAEDLLRDTANNISDNENIITEIDVLEDNLKEIREQLHGNRKKKSFKEMVMEFDENISNYEDTDRIMSLYPSLDRWTKGWGKGQLITVAARTGVGKAVDINTPILTKNKGIITMGDINEDDTIYDEEAIEGQVVKKSEIMEDRDTYNVNFKLGENYTYTIVADTEHVWKVIDKNNNTILKTSEEINDGDSIPTTKPIDFKEKSTTKEDVLNHTNYINSLYMLGQFAFLDNYNSKEESLIDDKELQKKIIHLNPIDRNEFIKGYTSKTDITTDRDDRRQGLKSITYKSKDRAQFIRYLINLNGGIAIVVDNLNDKYTSIEQNNQIQDTNKETNKDDRYKLVFIENDLESISSSGGESNTSGGKRTNKSNLGNNKGVKWGKVGEGGRKLHNLPAETESQYRLKHIVKNKTRGSKRKVRCFRANTPTHTYLIGENLITTHNSFFATNSAIAAGVQGKSVLIFNLEMEDDEIVSRLVACRGLITLDNLYPKKRLAYGEKQKYDDTIKELMEMKLDIVSEPNLTLGDIKDYARSKKESEDGLDLIIIDYIQLLTHKGRNRREEVEETSRGLKILARELEVPIIVLSQVRRPRDKEEEEAPPTIDQIRETGAIAQDSDIVIIIHKPKRDESPQPKALFILEKNRSGEDDKYITVANMLDKGLFQDTGQLETDAAALDELDSQRNAAEFNAPNHNDRKAKEETPKDNQTIYQELKEKSVEDNNEVSSNVDDRNADSLIGADQETSDDDFDVADLIDSYPF